CQLISLRQRPSKLSLTFRINRLDGRRSSNELGVNGSSSHEKLKTKILFAILATLVLVTASYSQSLDRAKLDRFLNRLAEKNKAMDSLTIAKDGKVLYSRAFGFSQITQSNGPLTAANRFRIGSITKMFTATIILKLAEEGKLKLSDTLDKFFPQIPNAQK